MLVTHERPIWTPWRRSFNVKQADPSRAPVRPSLEDEMSRTPNDDRSDSMNPNNDAYWSSLDNHSNQLNPNNEAYDGPSTDDEE